MASISVSNGAYGGVDVDALRFLLILKIHAWRNRSFPEQIAPTRWNSCMSHPAVIHLDKLNGWWNRKPEKSLTGSKLVGEVSAESVRGDVVDVCHVDLQRRHVVDPAT